MTPLHLLFAQTAVPAAPAGPSGMGTLVMMGAIFAIFYFIMIRPQQKQRKAHEAAILAIKKGDQIITVGGIVGEVIHIKEGQKDGAAVQTMSDQITIRSGDSKLVVTRGRVAVIGTEDAGPA